MARPLDEVEFEAENLGDFSQLLEGWVRKALFKVGQSTQGHSGELRQISLTQTEQFPSGTNLLANLLGSHFFLRRCILVRFLAIHVQIDRILDKSAF